MRIPSTLAMQYAHASLQQCSQEASIPPTTISTTPSRKPLPLATASAGLAAGGDRATEQFIVHKHSVVLAYK